MSSVYVLEPPTQGKVVLNTTMGPLDIELWPKEAPKAVRNFVQLCLEGYYDRTIFHRVMKSFLVQGGDPTGTGTGGESIYGEVFSDEFHSRLRFNHRGVVACANAGSPHSNGSQFFMTLDRSDWLDRKNTIFGKVTGDSIYNLLTLGEVETDTDDRPLDPPPKILSVEVLWNPFDDIIPRQLTQISQSDAKMDNKGQDQKKKAVKQLNVLSFGEEVEEEETENLKAKIKSIHDVLDDPRFLKEEPKEEPLTSAEVEKRREVQLAVRETLSSKKDDSNRHMEMDEKDDGNSDDDDEANFDSRMRMQILRKRRDMGDVGSHKKKTVRSSQKERDMSPSRSKADNTKGQTRNVEKLSIKKGIGSEARADRMAKADTDLELFNHAEQERQMQKQKRRRLQGREDNTLGKLDKFRKSCLTKTSAPSGSMTEGGDNEDTSGWMGNPLKFNSDSSAKVILFPLFIQSGVFVLALSAILNLRNSWIHSVYHDGILSQYPNFSRKTKEIDEGCVSTSTSHIKHMLGPTRLVAVEAQFFHLLFLEPHGVESSAMARKEDPSDYVVYDPLLEKGKEKFNRMQAKLKRRDREWAGKPLNT